MDKLKALYNSYIESGLLSKNTTFEQFSSADSNIKQNLYNKGVESKIISKSTNFDTFNSAWSVKKKGQSDSVTPKDIMESTTKEREQNFSLDLLKKDEDEAKPLLQDKLTGKGYSIETTGIGDALNVTDNITGEVTEIDLQPFTDSGTSEELSKINKILNSVSDIKRSLLSTNNKEDFDSDVDSYIENLKSKYSNFNIESVDKENIRISKGDKSQVFKVKNVIDGGSNIMTGAYTPDQVSANDEGFSQVNKFLYENINDNEALSLNSKLGLNTFKFVEEGLKNIESTVDVSVEAAEAEVYNKEYFKGLFDFLESNGVAIPEEAKNNLSKGTKSTVTTRNKRVRQIPLTKEEIQQNIQKYFGENLDMINAYDVSKIVSVRKQKINRAKKLKTEIFYDSLPNKEEVKEVLRQSRKNITEEELDITANVKLAENDIKKMYNGLSNDIKNIKKNNPNAKFTPLYDDNGMLIDITSDTPIKELDELNKRVRASFKNYSDLYEISKYKLEKLAAKKGTTDEFMDASNRNYDLIDNAMADLKNAAIQLGGGLAIIQTLAEGAVEDVVGVPVSFGSTIPMSADLKMKLIRGDMKESREKIENFFETRRTYDEALEEGSVGRFSTLTFAQQAPNIALAIGTSGAGTSLGLGKLGTQLLIGTQFGLTSSGQKYDELTTRQEFGNIAKKGLKELEELKGIIPDKEYLIQKYELERALKDSEISSADKTLSVIGTGIVEGSITSFLGTAPNSIKVLKDLKNVKSVNFIKDILKSNYKAAGSAVKEFGKRTGGEVLEEESIDLLTQVNDYLFLGDQIDLSTLDDTAVTSIITSGTMNTPSIAYSTILKQINVNRYKNAIQEKTKEIQSLKDILNDTDMSDLQRSSIHNSINSVISSIADETTAMEGDALLMGADSIREMLTLNGVKDSMLKKAEVESDDSYEVARTKVDNYLSTLSEGDAKKFIDQMKYIDNTRNKLLGNIKYEGAVAKVFGEKGKEIANKLDPTLTPKQKYVEVYKQIRQEINDNAKKEFDAIQEQETRDIPDAQPAEGVQEMEEEVGILNKSIEVSDSKGKKGLVPISELESFIGEDRVGDESMPTSRETIDKLKNDIKKNGFKEPIIIVYDKFSGEGEASIIEGNHRIVAAKELGLTEIPVTFEKGTIRSNESRLNDNMFPLNRKTVGKINDTFGVKGSDLGLTVRQPIESDYKKAKQEKTEKLEQNEESQNKTTKIPEGNRLRTEPLEDAKTIAEQFTGGKESDTSRTKEFEPLVEERSKEMADVYDKAKATPNDQKTIESYKALAKETIEQFKSILKSGYKVTMSSSNSYKSSSDMIKDLKENKRMFIFPTKDGFGSKEITPDQVKENILLEDSGFKDSEGNPMLINDVFRFVHDFFGHAKEGNSFGPKGEEIAWQVHSKMYSPKARRAMTTETRGQNSWVNFSGANDAAFKLRDEARALRKKAESTTDVNEKKKLLEEALAKVEQAYENMKFADQKMFLIPDKYVFPSENDSKNEQKIIKSTKRPRKKVVIDEYAALKDQIRLEARAARDAQKDLNLKRKDLSKIIKDLAGKGIITANQSIVLINRISSVNLNNQKSVDNLIKYMDKVYQNADYANTILRSNKNRKRAKKNIRTKIGSANVVFNTLNKLFSIDAKIIPQNVLDIYNELVSQFGESKAVLKLEDVSKINEKANSILEAIDNEISEIPKLQLLFESLDKANIRGKEDFSATLEQALSDNKITKEDYDLIKKYKKDIVPSGKTSDTKETPTQFKFKENNVEDKMESKGADRLIDLLKNKKAVDQLSDSLKRNIQAVIDNIDAGFFPSYANNISNEIESIIAKDNVIPRLKKGKYIFDRVTSKIKNLFSSKKSTTEYQIRQNPLSDVDNILGNMNRTDIYDNIFGKAAKSYASLDAQIDIVKEKIAEADALLFKQFNNNGNKVTESKYRIMAYMLEREFQSNKDSNKVFSASESIKAIIDAQKKGDITTYSKKDIQILESILKDFQGDVDLNSKFDKFSKREKKAMSIIDDVNKSLSEKALYTASVIRGSRPNMIDNYVHHSVIGSNEGSVESITNKYNQFKTFSTKAGTLVERTPGVKPINFDILNSTLKGAKETLVDYHMTDTARVIFKTLNKIKADIVADEKSTERQIETANALSNAFDTAMRQVFETNYVSNGINLLGKAKGLGYKALLASVPRASAELSSNLAYVIISSPKSFYSGIKYKKYTLDQRGRNVMMNLNSEQTGKLYSKKVTGKTADIGLFADSEGSSPTGAINDVQNKGNQILSYLANLTVNPTEKIAEGLISTPDKAISRPLWFGSLDNKFKEITGNKIDMDAINNGDNKYLEENKDALNEATIFADKEVTRAATSVNVFNGILKNKIDPNDSTSLKVVKEINGFMSNFIIYEYTTARSALSALINSGEMSRKKGAALLLATTTRMSLYMVLYQSFSHLFDSAVSAITGADIGDEEFPEEDLLIRQLVGSISSMILGKNLGNFAKIIPNMSLETINEKYLEDLRKGEDYDPYKHSISFSMLSKEDLKKIGTRQQGVGDVLLKALSGPYSPIVKTLSRAVELGAKATSEKSKDSTKQKAIEELTTRIIIEMMGNVGMIPFYKDVRRIVIKDFFKEEDTKKKRRPSSIIINRR